MTRSIVSPRRRSPTGLSQADPRATAAALSFYALGLVGYSLVKVLTPVYYALGYTRIPVATSVGCVMVNIVLNFSLMDVLGHRGLALATSISGLLNAMILSGFLGRHLPDLDRRGTLVVIVKTAVAAGVMGLACHQALAAIEPGFWGPLLQRLLGVAGHVGLGFVVYGACAKLAGISEVEDLVALIRRRVGRGR